MTAQGMRQSTGGIFINDRTVDSALGVVVLEQKLIARFGRDAVFRDSRSVERATEFEPVPWSKLRRSDVLLVVIGPHWLSESGDGQRLIDHSEDFVRREIAEALRGGVDLLPVLTGDARPPVAADLPKEVRGLAGRQHHVIRARDPEPDIERLVAQLAVRQELSELPMPAREEWEPAEETRGGININKITAARDVIVGDQTNYLGRGA